MAETTKPDSRLAAVLAHFQEWHGAAPDETEALALLARVDRAPGGLRTAAAKALCLLDPSGMDDGDIDRAQKLLRDALGEGG